jgi:ATP-dependent Clp protease ATP-binding subunit ClpC
MQCIGATTVEEYRRYVEKDAALERRFQPIKVEEPTPEQTVGILTGLCSTYEEHHEVHSPLTSEKPPSGREAQ